jgi:hypothetical protein
MGPGIFKTRCYLTLFGVKQDVHLFRLRGYETTPFLPLPPPLLSDLPFPHPKRWVLRMRRTLMRSRLWTESTVEEGTGSSIIKYIRGKVVEVECGLGSGLGSTE